LFKNIAFEIQSGRSINLPFLVVPSGEYGWPGQRRVVDREGSSVVGSAVILSRKVFLSMGHTYMDFV